MFEIFGTLFIPIAYGKEFTEALRPFQILVIAVTIYSFHKIIATYYVAIGKVRLIFLYSIITLFMNTTLSYLLVPIFGLKGAAIGTFFSYLFVTIVIFCQFKKDTERPFIDFVIPTSHDIQKLKSIIHSAIFSES